MQGVYSWRNGRWDPFRQLCFWRCRKQLKWFPSIVKPISSVQTQLTGVKPECRKAAVIWNIMFSNVYSESFILNIFINKTYKAINVIWRSVKNNQAQNLLLDFLWQVPEPTGRMVYFAAAPGTIWGDWYFPCSSLFKISQFLFSCSFLSLSLLLMYLAF